MSRLFRTAALLVVLAGASRVLAYDIGTHARMTDAALKSSSAVETSVEALGLAKGIKTRFGRYYFDIASGPGTAPTTRRDYAYDYEFGTMPGVERSISINEDGNIPFLLQGWLMRGSIREDDGGWFLSNWIFSNSNPHDDPSGPELNRFCNHFYDPVRNLKLNGQTLGTVCWFSNLASSPAWALGVRGLDNPPGGITNTEPMPVDTARRNHYSVLDAREAMWRALTLRQFRDPSGALMVDEIGRLKELPKPLVPYLHEGGPLANQSVFSSDPFVAGEQYRNAYWATAFFSLGSALHLIQDVGQPQHTRAELHPFGPTKEFERYIEARAMLDTKGRPTFRTWKIPGLGVEKVALQPISYLREGMRRPMFGKYSDYWTTVPGGDVSAGLGMADYSNRGFFTFLHNIGGGTYALPPTAASAYTPVRYLGKDGYAIYLTRAVHDSLDDAPSAPIRMIRKTMYDDAIGEVAPLAPALSGVTHVLDSAVFDDYAGLLIPRAVDYSAGFLDKFFRGRMRINPPDAGFYGIVDHASFDGFEPTDAQRDFKGFDKIKLRLANVTPALTPPRGMPQVQDMGDGTLVAVLKFNRNRCYNDSLSNWPSALQAPGCRLAHEEIVVSAPLDGKTVPFATAENPAGDELTFDFSGQPLPVNAWDVVLQVVYRGRLGHEADAVVVATLNLSEPTFLGLFNATDRVTLDGVLYTPEQLNADQSKFSSVHPACKIQSGGIYRLSESCYNFAETFVFASGREDAPPVTIAAAEATRIPPRRFARVAFLSDATNGIQLRWNASALTCWRFRENPLFVKPYVAQRRVDDVLVYQSPTVFRGINNSQTEMCYADVGVQTTHPDVAETLNFGTLQQGLESVPMPLSIAGW